MQYSFSKRRPRRFEFSSFVLIFIDILITEPETMHFSCVPDRSIVVWRSEQAFLSASSGMQPVKNSEVLRTLRYRSGATTI
jgi:hypothetical protein